MALFSHHLGARVGVKRALFVSWILLFAVSALGHVTGLRNTLLVLVVVLSFIVESGTTWLRDLPAWRVWLLIILWGFLSLLWSAAPDVTFSKWRSDLLLPLLIYASAFSLGRTGRSTPIRSGLLAGVVVLALMTASQWMPLSEAIPSTDLAMFALIPVPMLKWYPGVGDASTFALLCVPIGALCTIERWRSQQYRMLVVLGWCLLALVLIGSRSRNAIISAPIGVACFFLYRVQTRGNWRSRVNASKILIAALVIGAATAGLLEFSAEQRLSAAGAGSIDGRSAALELLRYDARPKIWLYYLRLGEKHPFLGVGFGRTLPSIAYRTRDDRTLGEIDPAAPTHAHNIFIDWWLQLGVLGPILLFSLLALVFRESLPRSGDSAASCDLRACLFATLALLVLRNLTDDLLVYGAAITYWAVLGLLCAQLLSQRRMDQQNVTMSKSPDALSINVVESPQ